ncbi:MAG: DUF1476 domain-containing protein [Maritimibacter sp.]
MTSFDDRENAFENKFAHDQEMQFKADSRCNKLLAIWAAEKMGREDQAGYIAEVIKADFEEAGHDDVIRKVAGDLGGAASEDEVRAKRTELLALAKQQLMNEV